MHQTGRILPTEPTPLDGNQTAAHPVKSLVVMMMRKIALPLALPLVVAGLVATAAQAGDVLPVAFTQYPAETQRLLAATEGVFAATEAGAGPLAQKRDHVGNLTGYRVTWYDSGPLLASVDFVGTAHNGRNLVCGYVTFAFDASGTPRLSDHSAHIVRGDLALSATPEEEGRILLEANCAPGDLAANFALSKRS